jgi:hypothetical protein
MDALKAGTRCECRECNDFGGDPFVRTHDPSRFTADDQCPLGAVRLVTVPWDVAVPENNWGGTSGASSKVRIPMCQACAEYHEAKGA